MGVIVQRHGDVGVAHNVLQRFRVHASVSHPGTESMPLRYNKNKSENPVISRGFGFVLILFPVKNGLKLGTKEEAENGDFT